MIISVKAMKMGLTNLVQVRGLNDDPHNAFADRDYLTIPAQMKAIFDGFMGDLRNTLDDVTGTPLADDVVLINKGDSFKDPLSRSPWGDNTPDSANAIWVYGAGHLYSGVFGDIGVDGTVQGAGPDGALTVYNGANTAKQALASILYAVAKRDDRLIQTFTSGIAVEGIFGPTKIG